MKRSLALFLLAASASAAPAPESVFSGLGASLGRYPRVTARLTYDPRKAAQGGLIYVVQRAAASDAEAIRLSEGLVTTSGGLLSRGAVEARAHRVPALILSRASWSGGALVVDEPKFGPLKPGPGGLERRALEGTKPRTVAENEVVTIDAAQGTLELYAAADQDAELALAEAVRAFEGLRDPDSMGHWFADRADSGGAELALRVAEETGQRLLAGTVPADEFSRVISGMRAALSGEQSKRFDAQAKSLCASLSAQQEDAVADASLALKEAGTQEAASRLFGETSGAQGRLDAACRTLGGAKRSAAFGSFEKAAKTRIAALSGRDSDWRAAAAAAGAPAPAGARLGADLYRRFLDDNGLQPLIDDIGGNASLDLRLKSERIRAAFNGAKLAPESALGKEILAAVPAGDKLHVETSEESQRFVARDKLLDAVKRAWASYWYPEPFGRRKRSGEPIQPEIMVEAAVPADISGAVFSRDPGTLRRERIVVEAAAGERETFDAGDASADEYALDRRSGREALPAVVAGKRILTAEQLAQIARAARALDGHFGAGVEARFAYSAGKLSILSVKTLENPAAIVIPSVAPASAAAPDVEGVKSLR